MKVKHVRFTNSITIPSKTSSSVNSHLSSSAWDLELVDYSHIEVREKGGSEIVIIIPFSRASFIQPLEQEPMTDLDDLDHEDELVTPIFGPDEMPAISVKSRVKSKANVRTGS